MLLTGNTQSAVLTSSNTLMLAITKSAETAWTIVTSASVNSKVAPLRHSIAKNAFPDTNPNWTQHQVLLAVPRKRSALPEPSPTLPSNSRNSKLYSMQSLKPVNLATEIV